MTPSRLSELKELAEKATDKHIRSGVRNFWGDRCAEYYPACNTCLAWKEIDDGAAARTAVPELVAEVERLREAVEDAAQKAKVAWLTTPYGSIADADAMEAMCNDLSEQIRAALGGQP